MITYEILKKYKEFGYWALHKSFGTETEALAYLSKARRKEPQAEFQMVENANPWFE